MSAESAESPVIDIADLAAQLRADGSAFTHTDLANDQSVQDSISAALHAYHGVAVVDDYTATAAESRNLAVDLQNATGLDTVIVQVPSHVSAVSGSLSRAELEAVQRKIPKGIDQVELLERFYDGLDRFDVHSVILTAFMMVLALAVAWIAFRSASRRETRSEKIG